jgi:hypothetical protein
MTDEHEDSDEVIKARRRKRAIALGIVLGAVVILFYAMTIARMGGNVFQKAPM